MICICNYQCIKLKPTIICNKFHYKYSKEVYVYLLNAFYCEMNGFFGKPPYTRRLKVSGYKRKVMSVCSGDQNFRIQGGCSQSEVGP